MNADINGRPLLKVGQPDFFVCLLILCSGKHKLSPMMPKEKKKKKNLGLIKPVVLIPAYGKHE